MYIGLHVQHLLVFSDFNETEFSGLVFEKSSNIKFRENPFSGSRVIPYGRTDMTKLIVAYRNFANASKKKTVGPV